MNGMWQRVGIVVLLTACACRGAEFQKLLAFPTANTVRLQLDIEDAELSAEITSLPDGRPFWRGSLGSGKTQYIIRDLKPKLWTPATPQLYNLKVIAMRDGNEIASRSTRIGFRSFDIKDAQFRLNGKPIFLRGIAINPPGRTIPESVGESQAFAHDYVKFLRSQNVNMIRLEHDSQLWFDACDELGMMLYQGVYGSPPAKVGERFSTKLTPPDDVDQSIAAYKHIFEGYAHHPSIVMYILSNELPYTGQRGAAWHDFLLKVHPILQQWDPTRPFIGNAGYGQGLEGDVNDIHRYWGWYYNSFLTYYNLRDPTLFGDFEKNQPLTFTECVGSFTGPTGAFNLVEKKQLGAALGWCGWADDQAKAANEHQCRVLKNATESFRTMRSINPRLVGIMPFTILFDNWKGIRSFDDMKPKPAMRQLALSYAPVLTSWELWTPQVYAGSTIKPTIHVINDAEDFADIYGAVINVSLKDEAGNELWKQQHTPPVISYYAATSKRFALELPGNLPTGAYTLVSKLHQRGKLISENQTDLFVAGKEWNPQQAKPQRTVVLYDPGDNTAKALDRLSIPFERTSELSELNARTQVLVIGEDSWGGPCHSNPEQLESFMRKGGRILCLAQDPQKMRKDWLPAEIEFFTASANDATYPPAHRPTRDQSNLNPQRPDHPIFEGLPRERLAFWSDYANWDQTKEGFPRIYPVTRGYRLLDAGALAKTAILIDYDRGLEGIALAEFFDGRGSVLLSGLDLIPRVGLDPAADRLLRNLVLYTASNTPHEIHPKVTQPIKWGDYPTQQGVLAGPIQGLLINVEWTPPPTDPTTKPLSRAEGSWNTRPSDQYVPRGIRPYGPYTWSTGTVPRDLNRESKTGSGFFWASIGAGKRTVVTKVHNPTATDATLSVEVNKPSSPTSIPAGQTVVIRTPLPENTTTICVRYTGEKDLVILETSFE